MAKRLAAAEAQLWEVSLKPSQADMLLPPAMLHAMLQEVQAERQSKAFGSNTAAGKGVQKPGRSDT